MENQRLGLAFGPLTFDSLLDLIGLPAVARIREWRMATTTESSGVSFVSGTRPRPLDSPTITHQLEAIVETWARSQHELVVLAAEFADSHEWVMTGFSTAAHWLAIIADVEPCTAREWIRIGPLLKTLPATADAFKTRGISYSKVRTLTRLATPENEAELLEIAMTTTAADLGRALAAWLLRNSEPCYVTLFVASRDSAIE